MKFPSALALLWTGLVACSTDRQHPPKTEQGGPVSADPSLPERFSASSAYVFLPQWEGAEGFSAGEKYVIQGEAFNESRTHLLGCFVDEFSVVSVK